MKFLWLITFNILCFGNLALAQSSASQGHLSDITIQTENGESIGLKSALNPLNNDVDEEQIRRILKEMNAAHASLGLDLRKPIIKVIYPYTVDGLKKFRRIRAVIEREGYRIEAISSNEAKEMTETTPVRAPEISESQEGVLKKWWKKKYVKPSGTEVWQGVVSSSLKGVIAATVWFSVGGIDPFVAGAIVAGMTLHELFYTIGLRTMDNIMSGRNNGERIDRKFDLKSRRTWSEMARRVVYAGFWAFLWRTISGPVGNAHSITTIQGNLEVLANVLAKSPAGSWLSSVKHNKLSRKASAWIGFPVFILGPILSNLDLAGFSLASVYKFPAITFGHYVIYQPTLSNLLIIALYGGLAASIQWGPTKWFNKYGEFMDRFTQAVGKKISRMTTHPSKRTGPKSSHRPSRPRPLVGGLKCAAIVGL